VLPYKNLVEILKTFLEFFAASYSEWFFVVPERPDKFQAEKQIDRVSYFLKKKSLFHDASKTFARPHETDSLFLRKDVELCSKKSWF
jgi:hypothetical protein